MKYPLSEKYTDKIYTDRIMGPNPIKLEEELMRENRTPPGAVVCDLGSGQGVTSVFLCRECGFTVYAADLWSNPAENRLFFDAAGLERQRIIPVKADAEALPFEKDFFDAVVSTDSYNYFGRDRRYLSEKLLPFVKEGGYIYIAVPGMKKDCHDALPTELLLSWTPEQMDYMHDVDYWRDIVSASPEAEIVSLHEMESNDEVWADWLRQENEYAVGDRKSMEAGAGRYLNFIAIVLRKRAAGGGDMRRFGLNAGFEALSAAHPGLSAARVVSQQRGLYRIVSARGEQEAEIVGKLRYTARTASELPAVGDFVAADTSLGEHALIHAVLPRKSAFIRRAAGTGNTEQLVAANIDTVFICMSLNNDFNLRRLERYLSVCWDSGARPVVVLTKADLCPDADGKRLAAESVAAGADVLVTSSMESGGWQAVLPYISEGKTVALLGSSGVGKSTLINRLLGEDRLTTNGLRNDDKGRHTTTHRELLLLPNGGVVIDTPGMRELGMWDSSEGVERSFADIEQLISRCRFSDCTHSGESGCAVRAAIDAGTLDPARYESYLKLKSESAYTADRAEYLAEKEKKFKGIAKINRSNKKR